MFTYCLEGFLNVCVLPLHVEAVIRSGVDVLDVLDFFIRVCKEH